MFQILKVIFVKWLADNSVYGVEPMQNVICDMYNVMLRDVRCECIMSIFYISMCIYVCNVYACVSVHVINYGKL